MSIPDSGKRRLVKAVAAGAASLACPSFLALASSRAAAQGAYPSRPIRIVVPFTPGGGTDLVARTVAEGMSRELGQPVIIDNKPGGGTVIGSDLVAKAPGDGHTLLLTTSAHAINSSLVKSLPYSTDKSFTDISLVARGPNMLVTHPSKPYRTVKDVIDAARANPGKLTYGSSGNGTAVHLAGELFKLLAQVDITHVPYRGAGPAYNDLMGGQIDLVFATAAGAGKFVESGKMRALAVTSQARSPSWPQVPTFAESGVPGYEADVWYAVFASGGTPAPIAARLNAAVRRAIEAPLFRDRVASEGLIAAPSTPEELTRYVRAEEARWRKVVVAGKVTID
jgi:tripartite-type tricarboxylate transporter receptor subunit TctC